MNPAPYPAFDGRQACAQRGVDPDDFFPDAGAANNPPVMTLCSGDDNHPPCPFLDGCFAYALTHAVYGIWGGTNGLQRERLRKESGIIPAPVVGTIRLAPGERRAS